MDYNLSERPGMPTDSRHRHPSGVNSAHSSFAPGFTMAEMLVTIVVGTVVIATIMNLFNAISLTQRNVWYEDVATRAARSEIENARAKGVGALTQGNTNIKSRLPASLPDDAKGTLNVGPIIFGQARLVTVTIKWQNDVKKVILSGTVGQQGLLP